MHRLKNIFALAAFSLIATLILVATPASAQVQRTWTVQQILDSRKTPTLNTDPRMCNGWRFKPCVCSPDVTPLVQYRPSILECGRKAGIVLSGRYTSAFSVVVRDSENRDRWPATPGFNGCTRAQVNAGLGRCSAFKVQKVIKSSDPDGDAEVHCLGASGYSELFKKVVRMTIKLRDVPGSNTDPLERLCLRGPDRPLN